jgi:hypothetical protein
MMEPVAIPTAAEYSTVVYAWSEDVPHTVVVLPTCTGGAMGAPTHVVPLNEDLCTMVAPPGVVTAVNRDEELPAID